MDTSVLGRAHQRQIGNLEDLAHFDAMWTCRMIELEVTYAVAPPRSLDR